jgi:hypothetical protein
MDFHKPIFTHDISIGTWDLDKELFFNDEPFNNDQIILSDGPDSYILEDVIKTVPPDPKYYRTGIIFRGKLYSYKNIIKNTRTITIDLVDTPENYKSPKRTNTFDYRKFAMSFIDDKRLDFYNQDLNYAPNKIFLNFSVIDLLGMNVSVGLNFSDDLSKADVILYYYDLKHSNVYGHYDVINATLVQNYIPLYNDSKICTIDYNKWDYENMMSLIIERVKSWLMDNGVKIDDFKKNQAVIRPFVEVYNISVFNKGVRIR